MKLSDYFDIQGNEQARIPGLSASHDVPELRAVQESAANAAGIQATTPRHASDSHGAIDDIVHVDRHNAAYLIGKEFSIQYLSTQEMDAITENQDLIRQGAERIQARNKLLGVWGVAAYRKRYASNATIDPYAWAQSQKSEYTGRHREAAKPHAVVPVFQANQVGTLSQRLAAASLRTPDQPSYYHAGSKLSLYDKLKDELQYQWKEADPINKRIVAGAAVFGVIASAYILYHSHKSTAESDDYVYIPTVQSQTTAPSQNQNIISSQDIIPVAHNSVDTGPTAINIPGGFSLAPSSGDSISREVQITSMGNDKPTAQEATQIAKITNQIEAEKGVTSERQAESLPGGWAYTFSQKVRSGISALRKKHFLATSVQ